MFQPMSTILSTKDKLFFLARKKGMQWGEIANQLGVSRQMVNAVRLGKKHFGEAVEERLNELVDAPMSTDVNQFNVNQPHVNQKIDELTNQAASLSARMDTLDARLATIEKLLLRLVADGGGKKES